MDRCCAQIGKDITV